MIRQGGLTIDLDEQQTRWVHLMCKTYREYKQELKEGSPPEDARYVLPNATKTGLATTFNLRQWRHVFKERALNRHAQWEIRGIFSAILADLVERLPAVFGDLTC
jgi:thymidylate synthase (FAD)